MVHKPRRSVQSWILITSDDWIWFSYFGLFIMKMQKFCGVYQMSTEKEGSPETLILFTSDSRSAAKKIEKLPMEKSNFAGYVQEATSSSHLGTTQLQRCFRCPILKKCKTPTSMSLSIAVALRRLRKTIQESKCELLHNTAIQRSLKYRTGRAVAASYVIQVCGPRTVDSPSSTVSRTIPVTNSSLWSDPRSTKCMAY